MNSNKFIPILGLLILLILAIGSISASEVDSDSIIGDSDANIDLTATQTAVDEIDGSSIDDEENTDEVIANVDDESISDNVGSIDDVERKVDVENSLGASADDEILASTVKFTSEGSVTADSLVGRAVLIGGKKYFVSANTTSSMTLCTDSTKADAASVTCAKDVVIYPGEAGAEGVDVYATLIFGENAYGTTSLADGGLEHIVKQLGSAGTADPLNQRATAGWKATHATVRLVEAYMIRIETASTFDVGAN